MWKYDRPNPSVLQQLHIFETILKVPLNVSERLQVYWYLSLYKICHFKKEQQLFPSFFLKCHLKSKTILAKIDISSKMKSLNTLQSKLKLHLIACKILNKYNMKIYCFVLQSKKFNKSILKNKFECYSNEDLSLSIYLNACSCHMNQNINSS